MINEAPTQRNSCTNVVGSSLRWCFCCAFIENRRDAGCDGNKERIKVLNAGGTMSADKFPDNCVNDENADD